MAAKDIISAFPVGGWRVVFVHDSGEIYSEPLLRLSLVEGVPDGNKSITGWLPSGNVEDAPGFFSLLSPEEITTRHQDAAAEHIKAVREEVEV